MFRELSLHAFAMSYSSRTQSGFSTAPSGPSPASVPSARLSNSQGSPDLNLILEKIEKLELRALERDEIINRKLDEFTNGFVNFRKEVHTRITTLSEHLDTLERKIGDINETVTALIDDVDILRDESKATQISLKALETALSVVKADVAALIKSDRVNSGSIEKIPRIQGAVTAIENRLHKLDVLSVRVRCIFHFISRYNH